jgi:hypothetical protein
MPILSESFVNLNVLFYLAAISYKNTGYPSSILYKLKYINNYFINETCSCIDYLTNGSLSL